MTTKRKATITICGRKIKGYPSQIYDLEFLDINVLNKEIDKKIEDTEYGKVDVYIKNEEQFTNQEMDFLENCNIMFN